MVPLKPPQPWTDEQRSLLRLLWPDRKIPRVDIARRLGRTIAACQAEASKLGIRNQVAPSGATQAPGPLFGNRRQEKKDE